MKIFIFQTFDTIFARILLTGGLENAGRTNDAIRLSRIRLYK